MNDDDEQDFLDGYTDDELLQLQEFIAEILDQDPDAEFEWVEFDAEDDNLDFTYEHAGVTLH